MTHAVRPERSPIVGAIQGIEIEIVGVVIWPGEIEIRLAGRPNDATREIDTEYANAVADWQARGDQGSNDEFPDNPARALFHDLRPELADDLGTVYSWDSGGGWGWNGSRGIHWGATHAFRPSPLPGAEWLEITIRLDREQTGTTRVNL